MVFARIVLFLVIATATAFAEDDCKPTPDLSAHLGPVHDQGNSDWCASFTAADLLTHRLQKQKVLQPNERVHPIEVAGTESTVNNESPNANVHLGGTVSDRLQSSLDSGTVCKETEFGSTLFFQNEVFKTAAKNALDFEKDKKAVVECKDGPSLDRLNQQMRQIEKETWEKEKAKRCTVKVPPLHWNYAYDEKWRAEVEGKSSTHDPRKNKILQKNIDEALEDGDLAAIEYDPSFMATKEAWPKPGWHYSSVVARKRSSSGECMYRIRNSWGKDCKTQYKNPENCERGYIWVSREKLLNATDSVTSLDDPPEPK